MNPNPGGFPWRRKCQRSWVFVNGVLPDLRSLALFCSVFAGLAGLTPALANDWRAELADGRHISVDLDSNRVQVVGGGTRGTPLWDGVHRLRDGSVITIRSGLMVPNSEVLTAREESPSDRQLVRSSACSRLIEKVCGFEGACDKAQSCDLARQLRAMQWSRQGPNPTENDWAEAKCRHSLADEAAFTPCDTPSTGKPESCQRLVRHLCGTNDRCASSEGCEVARQMLDLERAAQRDGADDYVADTRRQCQSAFREHAVFPPCR